MEIFKWSNQKLTFLASLLHHIRRLRLLNPGNALAFLYQCVDIATVGNLRETRVGVFTLEWWDRLKHNEDYSTQVTYKHT